MKSGTQAEAVPGMADGQEGTGILAINAGSSSLKFALFNTVPRLARVLTGRFERIGLPDGMLAAKDLVTGREWHREMPVPNHSACVSRLWELLAEEASVRVLAISHRIVHGGPRYHAPALVTPEMIAGLREIAEFAPLHLPMQIALLEEFARHYPGTPQVACFDTGFHWNMPRVAKLLPLPRRYDARGLQRYGFHGVSYTYLLQELERVAGPAAARGRVIFAHLGNGASLAAVRDGRSLDTTMAFTPAAGLVMSTRPGDLDPGLMAYLARRERMSAEQFGQMVNGQCELLGVSEISPDIRDLLAKEDQDPRAAEAVALFCQQARKWIGAYAAVLNGLDTLVFSAGIGENAAPIRARICAGFDFLGLQLDAAANESAAPVISTPASKVCVRIIRTDEELCLTQSALALAQAGALGFSPSSTTETGVRV